MVSLATSGNFTLAIEWELRSAIGLPPPNLVSLTEKQHELEGKQIVCHLAML